MNPTEPAPRILLIDDNRADRLMAARELRREIPKVEVREVIDEPGFRAALGVGAFDVVVTDYQLHWSDGLQVLNAVKSRYPYRPVVMYTATATQEIAVEAMKRNLDDYVVKSPHHLVRLSIAVRTAMERADLRRRTDEERSTMLAREQRLRAEAESANRLKDEFLLRLSHELRTPLNGILGWSRLLSSGGVKGEELGRAVGVIERNSATLLRLVEDLLDTSAVIGGRLSVQLAPVDLELAVHTAVDTVRPAALLKEIAVTANVVGVPASFAADPARLHQALWNLVSNAVKFTGRNGRVEVRAEGRDDHVLLEVSDNGEGIEASALASLAQPFGQVDGSIMRRHSGLGVGLWITRQIAEAHGGALTLLSDGPGKGTKAILRLPLPSPGIPG